MRRKYILAGAVVVCLLCGLGLQAQQSDSSASDNTNLSASSQPVAGTVPRLIKFTGAVKDLTGKVPTGVVGLIFSLYELPEGGSPLWVETQSLTLDSLGHYTALLGANSPEGLPLDLFTSSKALWLGVQAQLPGQPEQPRVLLVAVPYALKSSDADTLGGLPASAYMLSANANTSPGSSVTPLITLPSPVLGAPPTSAPITGAGTANYAAMFTGTATIGNSLLYNSPRGFVGIGTTLPAHTLDVNGTGNFSGALNGTTGTFSGTLTAAGTELPATGTATPAQAFASNPFDLVASAFSSTTNAAVPQLFRWKAEPAANNTSSPSGTLNLLYLAGSGTPAETGLSIAPNGQITFASGQTFPGGGGGTITGVTAGTDLTGGGTSGSVTLNLDTTKVPTLAASSNIFTGSITASAFSGDGTNVTNVNAAKLGGLSASAFQPLGAYATLGGNTFTAGQTISSGDLSLPQTTGASTGAINLGGSPFLHACCAATQNNTFVGSNAGNFGMTGGNNTASGAMALYFNTTGSNNTASGYNALLSNTTGYSNTASGEGALALNTTGWSNTASGSSALNSNTMGQNNTATGFEALQVNTTGSLNTAIGNQALASNTTANYNTAVGFNALYNNCQSVPSNCTGNYNTAVGFYAGVSSNAANGNITGAYDTFIGSYSGPGTSTQLSNATAIGAMATVSASNALVLGGTGSNAVNVGIGTATPTATLDVVGNINSSGTVTASSFVGNGSGLTDVSPSGLAAGTYSNEYAFTNPANSFTGNGAGLTGVTTSGLAAGTYSNAYTFSNAANSFTGSGAGLTNLTAANIAAGTAGINITGNAATATTAGNAANLGGVGAGNYARLDIANTFAADQTLNTALKLAQTTGADAGVINLGGSPFIHACCSASQYNTFVGSNAGNFTTTGSGNTASGWAALESNTTGSYNTASGINALESNTTGSYNAASGFNALFLNTTASYNTASGTDALYLNCYNVSGSCGGNNNTAVGYGAGLTANEANANVTGANNTFIGYNSGPGTSTQLNNATAIGANAVVSASNSLVLGATGVNVGIGTPAPAATLEVNGTAKFDGLVTFASGQTFPGVASGLAAGTYGNAYTFTNAANSFTGSGAGLTGVSASGLAAGTYSNAYTFSNAANSFTASSVTAGSVSATTGVSGSSSSSTGYGVYGANSATTGAAYAVFGTSSSITGYGVYGTDNATGTYMGSPVGGIGVYGQGYLGVYAYGSVSNAVGVWGAQGSGTYAGWFAGPVEVTGLLTKGGGGFKIDHPLDPADKYLVHSFVESPDMKNVYDGVKVLDANGEAWVDLPDWFETLNSDFRYQLTAIGAPAPGLYIAEEISGNRFKIAGGKPGGKVSWQVTGIRQDAFAKAHRLPVEEEKPEAEKGFYLHPELFGQPKEKGIEWAHHPQLMRQLESGAKPQAPMGSGAR
jgi:hypothetical protein